MKNPEIEIGQQARGLIKEIKQSEGDWILSDDPKINSLKTQLKKWPRLFLQVLIELMPAENCDQADEFLSDVSLENNEHDLWLWLMSDPDTAVPIISNIMQTGKINFQTPLIRVLEIALSTYVEVEGKLLIEELANLANAA